MKFNIKIIMCTTLATSASSSLGNNIKEYHENIEDTILYFENVTEKGKDEAYFKDPNIDFQEAILEKSKDKRFAKVNNFYL